MIPFTLLTRNNVGENNAKRFMSISNMNPMLLSHPKNETICSKRKSMNDVNIISMKMIDTMEPYTV